MTIQPGLSDGHNDFLSGIVRVFLRSRLSVILILFSLVIGAAALKITPREEDPQIVVPLADIYVEFPGHSAEEVEQLVSTPLERMLFQIDGVEYVYSMSRDDSAIVTVRFHVGEDRERSLIKLFAKVNENIDTIAPGVASWVMKPVEIDDVPIVTLSLIGAGQDGYSLRRIGEEFVERLANVPDVNRAFVIGGQSRVLSVYLLPERLQSHGMAPLQVARSVNGANVALPAGEIAWNDEAFRIDIATPLVEPGELGEVVVGVFDGRPVFLKDVAEVTDGPGEITNLVRHGWGPARNFEIHPGEPASIIGGEHFNGRDEGKDDTFQASETSVTLAISKKKGANAVAVADGVIERAHELRATILPGDVQLIVTRNSGQTANHKVNELVEALGVAIVIVVLLLTVGLGFREAMIVAVAVPVVFGLTLAVNLLFGFTINRVTLFALILSLGLLVDDPIVDVENIARHFHERKKATRRIVLDAVAEIRPPLISATLAVIVSFLPMFFITGMMGPYMSPMALNVPVAMLMSMLVAFTITPWLTYQVLKRKFPNEESGLEPADSEEGNPAVSSQAIYDVEQVKKTLLYRIFRPMMIPLLKTRLRTVLFLVAMAIFTVAAAGMGALRMVPLKMLPFDNKNELLLVLDMEEGTTLERTDATVRELEKFIGSVPEVTDYISYVGVPGPIDFNGLVRHYYLRRGSHFAEMRVNLVGKKHRKSQSHAIGLRIRDELNAIAEKRGGVLRLVELPPGPPVLASLVAEVTGRADLTYDDLLAGGDVIANRLKAEPGVVEVDSIRERPMEKWTFVADQEKASIAGVSVEDIASTLNLAVGGHRGQTFRTKTERNPLRITFQLPRPIRSSQYELAQLPLAGRNGKAILLGELGAWKTARVGQTIYHKNLQRIVYVTAECAGRTPAECIVDIQADRALDREPGLMAGVPVPVESRTYLSLGSGIQWNLPDGMDVSFAGEGEWKITLDVFRDLGLAFGAAMLMIYVILVAQTGSFLIPVIVMLAIPLTMPGVMPGFWLLNQFAGAPSGNYADPVLFTATAMIGMIALAGIVTRDSIILVDFMEQAVRAGRPLFDAILESRVIRLRPILLTASAALLSAIPITLDPIFSGLGWSLIFGLIASTVFTLFVIPATYWLLKYRPSGELIGAEDRMR